MFKNLRPEMVMCGVSFASLPAGFFSALFDMAACAALGIFYVTFYLGTALLATKTRLPPFPSLVLFLEQVFPFPSSSYFTYKSLFYISFRVLGFLFSFNLLGAFLAFSSLGAGLGKRTQKRLVHIRSGFLIAIKENTAVSIVQTELQTVYSVSYVGKFDIIRFFYLNRII